MANIASDCFECEGSLRLVCQSEFMQEVMFIKACHAWDSNELSMAYNDPSVTPETTAAIREANELEAVHLTDHRAEELAKKMAASGCSLNGEQVKSKLIARIIG